MTARGRAPEAASVVRMRRSARVGWLLATVIALLAACADSGGPVGAADDDGLEEVTFALSWLPLAEAAGWFVALDEGWFEEEGLDVEIARGFGSGDTAQRVATGEADFGIVDMSALVPMRLNEDLPVTVIAAHFAEPFHAVAYRPGDGIAEPTDLEGRSISCSAGNAMMLMFPAFARQTGIDEETIQWRLGDPGSINPAFLSGQTDAACVPVVEGPVMEVQSDEPVEFFAFLDHGVSVYSQMLVTADRTAQERPDLVERFLRAALRGLEYAIDHPEDAIDTLLAYQTDLDRDLSLAAWMVSLDRGLMSNDHTEEHGIGHISPERMQETFDTLVEAAGLDPSGAALDDLYTTEFLP